MTEPPVCKANVLRDGEAFASRAIEPRPTEPSSDRRGEAIAGECVKTPDADGTDLLACAPPVGRK